MKSPLWVRGCPVSAFISSGYDVLATEPPIEGLAGVLRKPYRFAEFQGLLQRILERPAEAAHQGSGDSFWTQP